jgi:hypothetical protein
MKCGKRIIGTYSDKMNPELNMSFAKMVPKSLWVKSEQVNTRGTEGGASTPQSSLRM